MELAIISAAIILFSFGLIAGSFTNALVYRFPTGESLMTRSHCTQCQHQITWYENIPLLSYLLLGGKCSQCKQKISIRYPAVEFLAGILFVFIGFLVWNLAYSLQLRTDYVDISAVLPLVMGYCIAFSGLLALSIIDIKHKKLPRQIIYVSFALLLLAQIVSVLLSGGIFLDALISAAICAAVMFSIYFALWFAYPKGMGFGDVRLAGLIGLAAGFFGWQIAIVSFFAAFFIAGIYGIAIMALNKGNRKTSVPFGPWMVLGLTVALVFGHKLIDIYTELTGLA